MTASENIARVLKLYNEGALKKQAIQFFVKTHLPEVYAEIMQLSSTGSFTENAYCFVYGISGGMCHCGKKTTFVSWSRGFSKTCSKRCMGKVPETKEKRQTSCFAKYGVAYPSKDENIKLRAAETRKNRTNTQKLETAQKFKETSLKNHGVEHPNKSRDVRDKTRKTNLERYGVEYPTQSNDVVVTRTRNNLKKYGVVNQTQVPEIRDRQVAAMFRRKEYTWKTGQISIVQGYEPIVLIELERQGYSFDEIKTNAVDIPEFWYILENQKKRYFPDIFIPKENLIIEVKSRYTAAIDVEKNNAKFKAVMDAGFSFLLKIVDISTSN